VKGGAASALRQRNSGAGAGVGRPPGSACVVCGSPVAPRQGVPGRRPERYCGADCRKEYWRWVHEIAKQIVRLLGVRPLVRGQHLRLDVEAVEDASHVRVRVAGVH
jgi:hypothetical protein